MTSLSVAVSCSSHLFSRHLFLFPSLAPGFLGVSFFSSTSFSFFLLASSPSEEYDISSFLSLDLVMAFSPLLFSPLLFCSFSLLRCALLCLQRPPLLHSILPSFALLCSTLACSSLLFLGSSLLCSALLCSNYSILSFFSARKYCADTRQLRNLYRQHVSLLLGIFVLSTFLFADTSFSQCFFPVTHKFCWHLSFATSLAFAICFPPVSLYSALDTKLK